MSTYRETSILEALLERYTSLSVSGVTAKAYPDKQFAPATGTPWLRASWLPAETSAPCMSYTDPQQYLGMFQVDLFQPVDSGENVPAERLGAIISHFKHGTSVTRDNVVVKVCKPPSRGPAIRLDGWQQYPVSIYVRAFKAQV